MQKSIERPNLSEHFGSIINCKTTNSLVRKKFPMAKKAGHIFSAPPRADVGVFAGSCHWCRCSCEHPVENNLPFYLPAPPGGESPALPHYGQMTTLLLPRYDGCGGPEHERLIFTPRNRGKRRTDNYKRLTVIFVEDRSNGEAPSLSNISMHVKKQRE